MNKFTIIGTGFIMPRHAEAIDFVKGKILEIINTSEGETILFYNYIYGWFFELVFAENNAFCGK